MSDRLTPEREAEIAERTPKRAAALTAWLNQFSPVDGDQRALENAETVLEEDVPTLLAELAAVRAERDEVIAGRNAAAIELREAARKAITKAEAERDTAKARVAELEKRDDWLSALEAAGVDNWEGYDDALEIAGEAS